jgi:hypothetical protein
VCRRLGMTPRGRTDRWYGMELECCHLAQPVRPGGGDSLPPQVTGAGTSAVDSPRGPRPGKARGRGRGAVHRIAGPSAFRTRCRAAAQARPRAASSPICGVAPC